MVSYRNHLACWYKLLFLIWGTDNKSGKIPFSIQIQVGSCLLFLVHHWWSLSTHFSVLQFKKVERWMIVLFLFSVFDGTCYFSWHYLSIESKRCKQDRSFPCHVGVCRDIRLVRQFWSPSYHTEASSYFSVVCGLHSQGHIIVQYSHCHSMHSSSTGRRKGARRMEKGQRKCKSCLLMEVPKVATPVFYWPEHSSSAKMTLKGGRSWEIVFCAQSWAHLIVKVLVLKKGRSFFPHRAYHHVKAW